MSDEPLIDAEAWFGDAEPDYDLLVEMQESWLPDEDEVYPGDVYAGRCVRWAGKEGQMMRLPWDQVHAVALNPFDPVKVATFAELIRQCGADGEKPLLYAPPAIVTPVTLDDVVGSQEAEARDELFASYGTGRPYTTGDEELDEYLADPDLFVETYAADDDDAEAIRADMVERAEEAVQTKSGDLGKLVGQLRDGNHRAMAAQLAGEPYVWVGVVDPGVYSDVEPGDME